MPRAATAKKKAKKKARKAKAKVKKYSRTSKDGQFVAVNIYVHRTLLDLLDAKAKEGSRSRRRQLHLELCGALGVDHMKLN